MSSVITLTNLQIARAAKSGVDLLSDGDLKIPLRLSKSGDLGVLEGLLVSLARGDCVVVNRQDAISSSDGREATTD